MALDLQESVALGKFVYEDAWTPVWGAYLYPLKYFGPERSTDRAEYLEVIRVFTVRDTGIAITRGGGLFVRVRADRTEGEVERVTTLLNLLLCELALHGLASQPITDTDVQSGKLIGRHAAIVGGFGDYGERTWGPLFLLASEKRDLGAAYERPGNDWWPPNAYWTVADEGLLDRVQGVQNAEALAQVGAEVPPLLVAAVSHASRHNIGETILTAWLVCEAILGSCWRDYVSSVGTDAQRRQRLRDFRTYTAAVQAEVLLTAEVIDEATYRLVQRTRKIRNDLAHGGLMSADGAAVAVECMKAVVAWIGVRAEDIRGFSFLGGGIGRPTEVLEPEFDFP